MPNGLQEEQKQEKFLSQIENNYAERFTRRTKARKIWTT